MANEDTQHLVLGSIQVNRNERTREKVYGSVAKEDEEEEGGQNTITRAEKRKHFLSKWNIHHGRYSKKLLFWITFTLCGVLVVVCPTILIIKRRTHNVVETAHDHTDTAVEYCDTQHCKEIATSMFTRMDPDADPCKDFYEYSCGSWLRSTEIPPGLPTIDTLYELRDKLANQIRVLIEEPIKDDDSPVVTEAKKNYLACTDEERLEERGAAPLTNFLEKLGGWPILGSHPGGHWEESTFDLTNLLSTINGAVDQGFIIATFVGRDDKNASRYSLLVDQGKLGLPNIDFYSEEKYGNQYLAIYFQHIKRIVRLLGGNAEDVDEQISDVIDFERRLASHMKSETQRRHISEMYHRTTISRLQMTTPQINWLRYFNSLGENKLQIGPLEEIIVTSPDYVKRALSIATDEVSPRTVVNYLLWRVVMKFANNLSRRFRQTSAAFGRIFVEPEDDDYDSDVGSEFTDSSEGLWKRCVKLINSEMSFVLGRMYVDAYYDDASQKPVDTMMSYIEESFIEMVRHSTWMDDKTKSAAIDKARSVDRQIGYPDWIMDDGNLQLFYKGLTFSADEHFQNYLNFLHWNFQTDFSRLRDPPSEEWARGPASVNAFYSFTNILTVPAGILQPPFYDSESPIYLNCGGIGMVIGHELTHGFDDKGRVYDKHGHLRESWWSTESQTAFSKHSHCIIEQYGHYEMKECNMSINGNVTVGENIADNGGIKEAYKAYETWKRISGKSAEPLLRLPGLSLTREQLLFINYAQIWCSKFTVDGARNKILTGRHSPGRYRVIGSLSNLPDFSRVFGCKPGSRMNPTEKCEVW